MNGTEQFSGSSSSLLKRDELLRLKKKIFFEAQIFPQQE